MSKPVVSLPDGLEKRHEVGFHDDFQWFVTAHHWTSLVADTSTTIAVADAVGGDCVLTTGATDNNEVALYTTKEIFIIAAGRTIVGEGRIKFAEADTDDANVCFGFADAIGANLLIDDGAGPKTSFSGALIYKVDGGTVWRCRSSIGSTYTDTITNSTAGGSAWQVLRIEISANPDTTTADIVYFLDGVQLRDTNNVAIKHRVTYASATEMQLGSYVKAGGSNSEVLHADYMSYSFTR